MNKHLLLGISFFSSVLFGANPAQVLVKENNAQVSHTSMRCQQCGEILPKLELVAITHLMLKHPEIYEEYLLDRHGSRASSSVSPIPQEPYQYPAELEACPPAPVDEEMVQCRTCKIMMLKREENGHMKSHESENNQP